MLTSTIVLVAATEEMPDEHLIRHINGRHSGAYGHGQTPLEPAGHGGEPFSLSSRSLWTFLHDRLHRDEWTLGHRHE